MNYTVNITADIEVYYQLVLYQKVGYISTVLIRRIKK